MKVSMSTKLQVWVFVPINITQILFVLAFGTLDSFRPFPESMKLLHDNNVDDDDHPRRRGLRGIMTVMPLPWRWKIFSQNNNSNCDKMYSLFFVFFMFSQRTCIFTNTFMWIFHSF
jgi:hypothetical protein